METLTLADPTATVTVEANVAGVIATSGNFGGGRLNIEYALAGDEATFAPLEGGSFQFHFQRQIVFPGTKLKFTVVGATADTDLNIETTPST